MRTKTFIAVILFPAIALSQTSAHLNINNINANFNPPGDLFYDYQNSAVIGFEVPKGNGTQTIFAGNLWFGALDEGEQLHLAAQTYHQAGCDFFQGPVMNAWNYSAATDAQWNKVWRIKRTTIDSFNLGLFR